MFTFARRAIAGAAIGSLLAGLVTLVPAASAGASATASGTTAPVTAVARTAAVEERSLHPVIEYFTASTSHVTENAPYAYLHVGTDVFMETYHVAVYDNTGALVLDCTNTGYVYLRARYYDPTTAQFITVDPLVDSTGTPYGYTGGATPSSSVTRWAWTGSTTSATSRRGSATP